LDLDEGIVEQAKFMRIHIIGKAEVKKLSARRLKRAILNELHQHGDGNKLPTDSPPGEFQDMLTELHGLPGELKYGNWEKVR
jgi:hypothetical protein